MLVPEQISLQTISARIFCNLRNSIMMKTPSFWDHKNIMGALLFPVSWLWLFGAYLRQKLATTGRSSLPVICIGNISVGGTGKTPLAAHLCYLLKEKGYQPAILTRGYGGQETGPLIVDPSLHDVGDVGDEPLMLSLNELVIVSRDRLRGAYFIQRSTVANVIIMDDGMQNPWLEKDMTIGVFDGGIGCGNNWIFPAGPLRQSLRSGLKQISIAVINGEDETGLVNQLTDKVPVILGSLMPDPDTVSDIKSKRLIAFAGIGRPTRFFKTVETCGADVVQTLAFADHHPYSDADLTRLHLDAVQQGAELVTTLKDWIRLPPEWRDRVNVLPVSMSFSEEADMMLMNMVSDIVEMKQSP